MAATDPAALQADIARYVRDYGWAWNVIRKVINQKYGTYYSAEEIQTMAESASLGDA